MNGRIPQKYIFLVLGISATLLFGWITLRTWTPIGWAAVALDWLIITTSIVLEVGGIGLLLNWILTRYWEHSKSLQRQIALERIFVTLYNNVCKGIRAAKSVEEVRVELKTNLHDKFPNEKVSDQDIDKLALVLARANFYQRGHSIERAMQRIDLLIDRVSDLFSPDFVSDLLSLTQTGYDFADSARVFQQMEVSARSIAEALSDSDTPFIKAFKGMVDGLSKFGVFFGLMDAPRQCDELEKQCRGFIKNKIFPRAAYELRKKIPKKLRGGKLKDSVISF